MINFIFFILITVAVGIGAYNIAFREGYRAGYDDCDNDKDAFV